MGINREILYFKADQNIVVRQHNVTLQDVAKLECADQAIVRQLKQKKIYTFQEPIRPGKEKVIRQVFSVLKMIELIHEEYPNLVIQNEGESDFVVQYEPPLAKGKWRNILLVAVLCIVTFFGAAFTIMAFNNDVGVSEVFSKLYFQVMGTESSGVTELEICYSIGLAVGIIIFFNHVGNKKITPDPTPLQVQMRKYEKDVDTTFIENAERKEHSIDVS